MEAGPFHFLGSSLRYFALRFDFLIQAAMAKGKTLEAVADCRLAGSPHQISISRSLESPNSFIRTPYLSMTDKNIEHILRLGLPR